MLQTTKLYVGRLNTSFSVEVLKKALSEVFGDFGSVKDVFVLTDKITRKPRGSAFVTMSTEEEAQNAQKNLDGAELVMNDEDNDPRLIVVNFARPLEEKPDRGSENIRPAVRRAPEEVAPAPVEAAPAVESDEEETTEV